LIVTQPLASATIVALALAHGLAAQHLGVEVPRARDVVGHDEMREQDPLVRQG
jgi:hypothetical protein